MRHNKDKFERRMTIWGVEYKLNRVIDATEKDIHHILSRKMANKFNVNNPKNKIEIQRRKHIALNNFFWWEAQAPHLQLKECLKIWESVLSDWVRETLYTLLSLDAWDFYKKELVKDKWGWKPLFDNNKNPLLKDSI